MNLMLRGKRALVTGGSVGIGVAIGRRLTRELIPLCVPRSGRPGGFFGETCTLFARERLPLHRFLAET